VGITGIEAIFEIAAIPENTCQIAVFIVGYNEALIGI
jgi:hypothetical protein